MLFLSVAAHAVTRTFPGPAPCDTTLQACFDGATDGDRIEIGTATPIEESVILRKGLTLTGAPGVAPIIGGTARRTLRVQPNPGVAAVLLEGLTLSNGNIVVILTTDAGGSRVEIVDCTVTNTETSAVRISPAAPGEIILRDSRLAGATDYVVDVSSTQTTGAVHISIVGNQVRAAALEFGGVSLDMRGSGSTTVDVKNNVIHDLQLTGIPIVTLESVAATVNIVNNTIARADRGLFIGTPQDASTLAVGFYNNIVASTVGAGIQIQDMVSALTFGAGFNDVFANGTANDPMGYSLGAPLFAVDPLFVDAAGGDFRLKAGSLLVDAGTSAPPSGLSGLDADGNARVAGIAVDVGAYEFGSSAPTTTTTSTTLPGCATGPTFASIRCRLVDLQAGLQVGVPAGKLATRLGGFVQGAAEAVAQAEQLAAAGKTRPRRKQLGRAGRALARVVEKLGGPKAATLDATLRAALVAAAEALGVDVATLRAQ